MATTEELLQQLIDLQKAQGSAKPLGGSSSMSMGGGGMENVKKVDGFFAGLIDTTSKLRGSFSATSGAVDAFGAVLGKIPLAGQTFSAALGASKDAVEGSMAMQKQLTLSGAAFNGGMLDAARTAAAAGLSNEEFVKQQRQFGGSMTGLAGDNAEAMKTLTEFQNDVRKSPIGKQLEAMNLSYDEQNRYINSYLAGSQNRDLRDKNSKEEAIAAFGKLTTSTLATSMATGQQTEAIQKQLQANNESLEIQTQLIGGSKEEQAAYDKILPSLSGLGPGITDLVNEALSPEGVTSDKATTTLSVLDTAGQDLVRAVQMQKEAAKEGATLEQKQNADRAMTAARAAIDRQMGSADFQFRARQEGRGNDIAGGAYKDLVQQRLPQLRANKAEQANLQRQGLEGTNEQVGEIQQVRAQRALAQQTPTGEKQVGSELIQGTAEFNNRAKAMALAFPVDQMTKFGKGLDALGTQMQGLARNNGRVVTPAEQVGFQGTPSIGETARQATPPARGSTRDEGTEGILGKKLEPKDAIVKIQKDEKVLDPLNAKMFEDVFGGIAGMKNIAGGKAPGKSTEGIDPTKMMGDIQKQMAPMMGDMQKQMGSMFNNIKLPIDDKQISSMFGNMKMPSTPNPGQLASMAKSMMPATDNSASAVSKDISGLKASMSAIAQPQKAAQPAQNEFDEEPTQPTVTKTTEASSSESFNSDVLKALNDLNKISAAQLAALEQNVDHAEKLNSSVQGLNGNRFA